MIGDISYPPRIFILVCRLEGGYARMTIIVPPWRFVSGADQTNEFHQDNGDEKGIQRSLRASRHFFFFFAPRDSQNSANGFAFALNVFREKCRLLRNIEEL